MYDFTIPTLSLTIKKNAYLQEGTTIIQFRKIYKLSGRPVIVG